jgi:hypothetical protein
MVLLIKLHTLLCNLLEKEGCLVLCHIEISQTTVLLTAFFILLGSPLMTRVNFIMFQSMVEKSLKLNKIFNRDSFKSKLKNTKKCGHTFGIFGRSLVNRI